MDGIDFDNGWRKRYVRAPFEVLVRQEADGSWVAWLPNTGQKFRGPSDADVVGQVDRRYRAIDEFMARMRAKHAGI